MTNNKLQIKSLDFYFNKLKKSNLKLTQQRKEVIICLLQHKGWHTIDDIILHLTKYNKKIPNIASVYNILHLFLQNKIINAFLDVNSFKIFFNLRHYEHEHIYCFDKKNNVYKTLPFDKNVDKKLRNYFENLNIKVQDYYIVANGVVISNEKECE